MKIKVKTNLVILGNRQSNNKFAASPYPIYLTESGGKSVLELILNNIDESAFNRIIFCVLESDYEEFKLKDVFRNLSTKIEIRKTPNLTKGSACSALLAVCDLDIDDEALFLSANEIILLSLNEILIEFRARRLSAGTLAFNSVHPRYSYVSINESQEIEEIAQGLPISNIATTGLFWFSCIREFIEATSNMLLNRSPVNDNFYIGLVLNELILDEKKVGIIRILPEDYIPLKDIDQRNIFQRGN